ncbi:hypothetical protein P3T18_006748 [Paraburkholderia sp. GAS199]|uniref:type II toxin-antitoxin system HicA family toxin n=1 Tax=Paraburkholderia sp. GAS199 TaxID=3035126 RepID=UPI003D252945
MVERGFLHAAVRPRHYLVASRALLKLISLIAIINMKSKHFGVLCAVFRKPTPSGIVFSDIEALIVALGGEVREGSGSRVALELRDTRCFMHRPHPGKEARRYQVEALREWLSELGLGILL